MFLYRKWLNQKSSSLTTIQVKMFSAHSDNCFVCDKHDSRGSKNVPDKSEHIYIIAGLFGAMSEDDKT